MGKSAINRVPRFYLIYKNLRGELEFDGTMKLNLGSANNDDLKFKIFETSPKAKVRLGIDVAVTVSYFVIFLNFLSIILG